MNLVDNDLHKLIFAGDRHEVVGKMGCLGVFRRHVYNPRLWLIVDARQPSRICDLEISASAFEFRMECREGEEDECDPMVALGGWEHIDERFPHRSGPNQQKVAVTRQRNFQSLCLCGILECRLRVVQELAEHPDERWVGNEMFSFKVVGIRSGPDHEGGTNYVTDTRPHEILELILELIHLPFVFGLELTHLPFMLSLHRLHNFVGLEVMR